MMVVILTVTVMGNFPALRAITEVELLHQPGLLEGRHVTVDGRQIEGLALEPLGHFLDREGPVMFDQEGEDLSPLLRDLEAHFPQ